MSRPRGPCTPRPSYRGHSDASKGVYSTSLSTEVMAPSLGSKRSGTLARHSLRRMGIASAGVSLAFLILVSSTATASTPWMGSGDFIRASYAHGSGTTVYCGKGVTRSYSPASRTGYFCGRSKVGGTTGGPGVADLEIGFSVREHLGGLAGNLSAYETGALHLAAGFARAQLSCSSGGVGYANASLLWQLAIEDYTTGQSVLGRVGVLWSSGNLSCSGGGSASARSPAFSGAFNSSAYTASAPLTGSFNATHQYLVFLRFFCTANAQVVTGSATASADCNYQTGAASNTFMIDLATFS